MILCDSSWVRSLVNVGWESGDPSLNPTVDL